MRPRMSSVANRLVGFVRARSTLASDPLLAVTQRVADWPVAPGVVLPHEISVLHAAANESRAPTYPDPFSGRLVLPSWRHSDRGRCCGCACRHCPFGHAQVPAALRKARVSAPVIIRSLPPSPQSKRCPGSAYSAALVFDPCEAGFIAARAALASATAASQPPPLLVTAFVAEAYLCAWSSWPLSAVIDASAAIGIDLLAVPLLTSLRPDYAQPSRPLYEEPLSPPVEAVTAAIVDAWTVAGLVQMGSLSPPLPTRALLCDSSFCGSSVDTAKAAARGVCDLAQGQGSPLAQRTCADAVPEVHIGGVHCSSACRAWKRVAEGCLLVRVVGRSSND